MIITNTCVNKFDIILMVDKNCKNVILTIQFVENSFKMWNLEVPANKI